MGLLTKDDAKIWRNFFVEMAKLRGIPCQYRFIKEQNVSIHSEFSYILSEPIDMDIIFDENPKVSTLRKIGWISENSDDKPYIAQLPFETPNLKVGCTISIKSLDLDSIRDFKITSMRMLLEFPDCYTCTLAPILFTDEAKTTYTETNYNYMDTPDADVNNDAPNNKYGLDYANEQLNNYTFLNVDNN